MSTGNSEPHRLETVHTPRTPHFSFFPEMPTADVSGLENIGNVTTSGGRTDVYATPALAEEVKAIRVLGGLAKYSVYHATSSVALPGIAKHGAILSASQLILAGEDIVTGEMTTPVSDIHFLWGGLTDVYASSHPSETVHAIVTKDAYPVIFGIDTRPARTEKRYWPDEGDGARFAGQVSLRHITSLAAPYENVPELQEWAAKNCNPGTPTMSLDAADALSILGS